ncbi:MAG: transposase [Pirellulales bacterium]
MVEPLALSSASRLGLGEPISSQPGTDCPWRLVQAKIEPEVVENMRSWEHGGFSVDQSVLLPAGDRAGIERLIQYMTRCPFSLSRLVKVGDSGQIIYQAEKQACRVFPDPKGDGTQAGVKRNFQILPPLDFLAEFTQHIPPKGSHLIRYYGWYSNKSRGMRKKAEADKSDEPLAEEAATSRSSQTWVMLIKRVYEVDPLSCPQCGGQMKVVAFIEPPQGKVVEKILRHGGLWQSSTPRAPPDADGLVLELDAAYSDSSVSSSDQAVPSQELTYVDIDTFLSSF